MTRKEQALNDAEYIVNRMYWSELERITDDELIALRAALVLVIEDEKRSLATTEILKRRHPDVEVWARGVDSTVAKIRDLEGHAEQVRAEVQARLAAATARIKALRKASK